MSCRFNNGPSSRAVPSIMTKFNAGHELSIVSNRVFDLFLVRSKSFRSTRGYKNGPASAMHCPRKVLLRFRQRFKRFAREFHFFERHRSEIPSRSHRSARLVPFADLVAARSPNPIKHTGLAFGHTHTPRTVDPFSNRKNHLGK